MMPSPSIDWPACIITAFDFVGTKGDAASGRASFAMIEMHRFAVAKINSGLPHQSHGYVWNDSVLLLSYHTTPARTRLAVLQELSDFKRALELQSGIRTYAMAVRGRAFPDDTLASPVFQGPPAGQPRAIVLKTSSWAMANCFLIEKALKRHRADWYIDSRITRGTGLAEPFATEAVSLLPKNEERNINMYKGFFDAEG